RLATKRTVVAVVLEAPLTSTVDVAKATYFWLPLGLLLTDKYNNERNIHSVTAPVLVLHGHRMRSYPSRWVGRSIAPPTSLSRSKCFPKVRILICSTMGRGERFRSFWRP